jgi:hypothetical protein
VEVAHVEVAHVAVPLVVLPLFVLPLVALPLMGCGADDGAGAGVASVTQASPELGSSAERWVVMQSHLHTTGQHDCATNPLDPGTSSDTACYSAEGVRAMLREALDYGASDMIITDHNNVDAWFDPVFVPLPSDDHTRYATPLRGTEWSSGQGHMTLFFPRQVVDSNDAAFDAGWMWPAGNHSDDPTAEEYTEAIERAHADGGLAIINHPRLRIHPWVEDSYGADGVEVGVPISILQSTGATRMWFHRRLVEADRLTAMAGSDHHHGKADLPFMNDPTFGVAVNLVRVDPDLPNVEDVDEALADPATTIDLRSDLAADAIRRGHVMVVEDLYTPRVYIGADVDGDGRYQDARAGDCVMPGTFDGDALPVRVRVTQADGEGTSKHYNVRFFTDADADGEWFWSELDPTRGFEQNEHYEVDPDDPFTVVVRVPFDPDRPGFVRVEVERDVLGPYNDWKTATNPIYFGSWGAECEGSLPLE